MGWFTKNGGSLLEVLSRTVILFQLVVIKKYLTCYLPFLFRQRDVNQQFLVVFPICRNCCYSLFVIHTLQQVCFVHPSPPFSPPPRLTSPAITTGWSPAKRSGTLPPWWPRPWSRTAGGVGQRDPVVAMKNDNFSPKSEESTWDSGSERWKSWRFNKTLKYADEARRKVIIIQYLCNSGYFDRAQVWDVNTQSSMSFFLSGVLMSQRS